MKHILKVKSHTLCVLMIMLVSQIIALPVYGAVVQLPTAVITSLDHRYTTVSPDTDETQTIVEDRAGTIRGIPAIGSFTINDSFIGSWTTGDTIRARIEVPSGTKFVLTPHPETESTRLFFSVGWAETGGSSLSPSLSVNFENQIGSFPSVLSTTSGSTPESGFGGNFIGYFFDGSVEDDLSFTAIDLEFTAPSSGGGVLPLNQFDFMASVQTRPIVTDHTLLQILPIPVPNAAILFLTSLIPLFWVKQRTDSA